MAGASTDLHEGPETLSDSVIDLHRALVSLQEELEAVDWYHQRSVATSDQELAAILAHHRDEEKEHAVMLLEQLRLITGGPIAWAQAVDGSVVMSLRGGDFELTLGEDFAIGFVAADAERVQLYLEESFAFRAHSPEAALVLAYQT